MFINYRMENVGLEPVEEYVAEELYKLYFNLKRKYNGNPNLSSVYLKTQTPFLIN